MQLEVLELRQKKAEQLAIRVYKNRPMPSVTNPSPNVPVRFYKLQSIAVKMNKEINRIKEENRAKTTTVKKTIGELRAMVIEEKRAIKEAGFSYPLRTI